jgi:hypothetical protein
MVTIGKNAIRYALLAVSMLAAPAIAAEGNGGDQLGHNLMIFDGRHAETHDRWRQKHPKMGVAQIHHAMVPDVPCS